MASAASRATSSARSHRRDQPSSAPASASDVALERRVERRVVGRVVADDVEQGRVRAPRVVEVRPAVGEPGPEVQQRRRGSAGDACVAVGRPGGHPLEEAEHRADLGDVVERGDEVHLGGAGVGEAGRHAVGRERRDQRARAVHASSRTRTPGVEQAVGVEGDLDSLAGARAARGRSSATVRRACRAPMPCSPETWPPRETAVRRRGRRRSAARAASSARNTERWTLPSPTWPHPVTNAPCRRRRAPRRAAGSRRRGCAGRRRRRCRWPRRPWPTRTRARAPR